MEIEKIEPPKVYAPWNVMFWEPESQNLIRLKKDGSKEAATLLTKSRNFLEASCIKLVEKNKWECLPLPGYNKTTYKIELRDDGYFCNCQGYNTKLKKGEEPTCSHIIAIKQFMFMRGNNI